MRHPEPHRAALREIAARIDAHLKRFEADPAINLDRSEAGTGLSTFYGAGAHLSGGWVVIGYVSYQKTWTMRRQEAVEYLEWLDAGNVGQHFKMARHG